MNETLAIIDLPTITRLEVIDGHGRSYVNWNVIDIDISVQDDDRTLKLFVKDKEYDRI